MSTVTPGSISGTVTAAGGGALAGICVNANLIGAMSPPQGSPTAADGTYTISDLAPGSYYVAFAAGCGNSGNWANQWFNSQLTQQTAQPVSVTAGGTTRSIDAVMQPGGSISGTVTAAGGGALSGICVNASLADGYGVAGTGTAADGTYTIRGLAAYSGYLVRFDSSGFCPDGTQSNYVQQWYDNKSSQWSADPVSVTAGQTHGSIDAVMQPGGSISGTVTAAVGGGALQGICVGAFDPQSGEGRSGTSTAEGGTYTLAGLAAGTYNVQFSTGCGNNGNYAGQWWNNQPFRSDADAVTVTVGATTGEINAALQEGGSISGTVTAAGGGALSGICVNVSLPDGYGIANTGTDAAGGYTISGLPQYNGYIVAFDASGNCPGGTQSNFIQQWYNGRSSQSAADPVAVTAGQTTDSIGAVMQPGGSISGTVTAAADGALLSGICVSAVDPQTGEWRPPTSTDNGAYTLSGLPSGNYNVQFSTGCGNPDNYASQWWENQPSQETANTVSVTAGATTGLINAVMAAGGSITGAVTASGGGALPGICVTAALPDGWGIANIGTDAEGSYTISGLPAGDYIVQFDSSGNCPGGTQSNYIQQWFNGKTAQELADPVTVTAGGTHGSIDAVMESGGSITGTVTAAVGGEPLPGICVNAIDPQTGNWVQGAGTGMEGTYTLTGLRSGDYNVQFSTGCGNPGNYASQWYDNQLFQPGADPVTVTVGQTHGSINAAMHEGGSISGTVTAAGGGALPGICVSVNLPDGWGVANSSTDSAGGYTISGLPQYSSYIVQFDGSGYCQGGQPSNYIQQWYNGQSSQDSANPVAVTAGQTHGSIDAVMEAGGSISGTVTAAVGDTPLSGICVSAFDPQTGEWMSGSGTGDDGGYRITGLRSGDYTVQFSTGCGNPGNYANQWYNDQPFQWTANTVTVSVGNDTDSIDAAMHAGGSISGTVSAAGGGGLPGVCVVVVLPDGMWLDNQAVTGVGGGYTISGLPAGNFNVYFDTAGNCFGGTAVNYIDQWYQNQPTQATADTVPVTAGETTDPINAVLQPGGAISGTVTAAGGEPALSGICVNASKTDGSYGRSAATDGSGHYTVNGLRSGDYKVSFDNSGYCPGGTRGNYVQQWYDNQPTWATADSVAVTENQTTEPINAALQLGGSISGTVSAGGGPLGGMCVNVFTPSGGPVNGNNTNGDGTYTVNGLAAGTYQVQFSTGCGNSGEYAAQWYNDRSSQATADAVTVSVGADTASIDAVMHAGGLITGTVTAAVGGEGLSGICVDVFGAGGGFVASAGTNMDGTYSVGVASGDYKVKFSAGCGNPGTYAAQWFDNKTSQATADNVPVTVGVTTDSINAALATVPGPPTAVSGTPGNTTVELSWTASTENGGSAITGYKVTPYVGGAAQTPQTFASTATTQTVTGLANGTAYTFTVAAINLAGTGPASAASAAVTPRTVPGAPTGVTGTPGDGSVSLSWTAPADNGGANITGYTVTPYVGAVAQTPQTFTSAATTETVSGLTNGTAYTFRVAAINAAGTGQASDPSDPVTPTAPVSVSVTTTSLPSATRGVSYSTTLQATGGTAPYSWAVTSGSLPNGLTLSTAGTISGTPSKRVSASTFTVTATDSSSSPRTGSKSFTIAIVDALSITTHSLPSAQQGTEYSVQMTAAGGNGTYVWSALGLPGGLTINSSTGAISGTPTAVGNAKVTVTVTDASSPVQTASRTYNLRVRA